MVIKSYAFSHNDAIPSAYTCDGEDSSPPLEFSEVPRDAKSLALIVDDPDAPGGTWVHWVVWNIDPEVRKILAQQIPSGAKEGKTSSGGLGYEGPCPPSGTHRYFFKLYALDAMLDLPAATDGAALGRAMEGHILASAECIGVYRRKQTAARG